jgi:hypothetical protein
MIIVNFATKEFSRGQNRLANSILRSHADVLLFNDYGTIGSPTHRESPYEFKIHSIEKALQYDDIVLWCDASLFLVGNLEKIEDIIYRDGYFMEEAGHYVKDWCNAHTRQYFGLKPEESGMTMFSAGLLGLDRTSPIAMEFFNQWKASALAGCFRGSWNDHRHDMTAGSIIAQRMGLKYQRGGSHMAYLGEGYQKPDPGVVFHLQGI